MLFRSGVPAGETSHSPPLARETDRAALAHRSEAYLEQHIAEGGLPAALVRALLYVRLPEGRTDERGLAALSQIAAALPPARKIGFARFKELVKRQFLLLFLDEEGALAAIPQLLPEDLRERDEGLALLRQVLAARGTLSAESRRRLERVETIFGTAPAAGPAAPASAAAQ